MLSPIVAAPPMHRLSTRDRSGEEETDALDLSVLGQAETVDAGLALNDYLTEYTDGDETYEATIHNLKLLLIPIVTDVPEANLNWAMERDAFQAQLDAMLAMLELKTFMGSILRTDGPWPEIANIINNSLVIRANLRAGIVAIGAENLSVMERSMLITNLYPELTRASLVDEENRHTDEGVLTIGIAQLRQQIAEFTQTNQAQNAARDEYIIRLSPLLNARIKIGDSATMGRDTDWDGGGVGDNYWTGAFNLNGRYIRGGDPIITYQDFLDYLNIRVNGIIAQVTQLAIERGDIVNPATPDIIPPRVVAMAEASRAKDELAQNIVAKMVDNGFTDMVFDLDGTLLNTDTLHREAMSYGSVTENEPHRYEGIPGIDDVDDWRPRKEEFEGWFADLELLKKILHYGKQEGVTFHINSDQIKVRVRKILDAVGILDDFKDLFFNEDVNPAPKLQKINRRIIRNNPKIKVLFIDDNPAEYEDNPNPAQITCCREVLLQHPPRDDRWSRDKYGLNQERWQALSDRIPLIPELADLQKQAMKESLLFERHLEDYLKVRIVVIGEGGEIELPVSYEEVSSNISHHLVPFSVGANPIDYNEAELQESKFDVIRNHYNSLRTIIDRNPDQEKEFAYLAFWISEINSMNVAGLEEGAADEILAKKEDYISAVYLTQLNRQKIAEYSVGNDPFDLNNFVAPAAPDVSRYSQINKFIKNYVKEKSEQLNKSSIRIGDDRHFSFPNIPAAIAAPKEYEDHRKAYKILIKLRAVANILEVGDEDADGVDNAYNYNYAFDTYLNLARHFPVIFPSNLIGREGESNDDLIDAIGYQNLISKINEAIFHYSDLLAIGDKATLKKTNLYDEYVVDGGIKVKLREEIDKEIVTIDAVGAQYPEVAEGIAAGGGISAIRALRAVVDPLVALNAFINSRNIEGFMDDMGDDEMNQFFKLGGDVVRAGNSSAIINLFRTNLEEENIEKAKIFSALITVLEIFDHPDENGVAAIFHAIRLRNIDIAKDLADKNNALNIRDNEGKTPLMRAIETGDLKLVSEILDSIGGDSNLDLRALSPTGATIFNMALAVDPTLKIFDKLLDSIEGHPELNRDGLEVINFPEPERLDDTRRVNINRYNIICDIFPRPPFVAQDPLDPWRAMPMPLVYQGRNYKIMNWPEAESFRRDFENGSDDIAIVDFNDDKYIGPLIVFNTGAAVEARLPSTVLNAINAGAIAGAAPATFGAENIALLKNLISAGKSMMENGVVSTNRPSPAAIAAAEAKIALANIPRDSILELKAEGLSLVKLFTDLRDLVNYQRRDYTTPNRTNEVGFISYQTLFNGIIESIGNVFSLQVHNEECLVDNSLRINNNINILTAAGFADHPPYVSILNNRFNVVAPEVLEVFKKTAVDNVDRFLLNFRAKVQEKRLAAGLPVEAVPAPVVAGASSFSALGGGSRVLYM